MGDAQMNLGPEELQKIGDYVRLHLIEWIPRTSTERELNLVERIVRVEEELKSQRELMIQGFQAVDKRFEDVNKRFESIDKRFEDMNSRFTSLQWTIGLGFTLIVGLMAVFNFY